MIIFDGISPAILLPHDPIQVPSQSDKRDGPGDDRTSSASLADLLRHRAPSFGTAGAAARQRPQPTRFRRPGLYREFLAGAGFAEVTVERAHPTIIGGSPEEETLPAWKARSPLSRRSLRYRVTSICGNWRRDIYGEEALR